MLKSFFKTNFQNLIQIPEGFVQMSLEQKLKYYIVPNHQPDDAYIFAETAFLSFKIGDKRYDKEELEKLKLEAFDQVFAPHTKDYFSEFLEEKKQIHYQFITNTNQVKFVMAIAALYKKKILNINFTCSAEDKDYWLPIIEKCFVTLNI